MLEAPEPLQLETDKRSHASWAGPKPRFAVLSGFFEAVALRLGPWVLLHVALLACALSGAALFMMAAYVFGAID